MSESAASLESIKNMARKRFGSATAARCGVVAGEIGLKVDVSSESQRWREQFQNAFDWAKQYATQQAAKEQ